MANINIQEISVIKEKKKGKYIPRKNKNVDKGDYNSYLYTLVHTISGDCGIYVYTDVDWYIKEKPEWVKVSAMSGNGTTCIEISLSGDKDCRGLIILSNSMGKLCTIEVFYSGINKYKGILQVPEGSTVMWGDGTTGDTYEIEITADTYTIGYTVYQNEFYTQTGEMTFTDKVPWITQKIHLNGETNLFTFDVKVYPEDCNIVWHNGDTFHKTSIITPEESAFLKCTISKDGYACKEILFMASKDKPNRKMDVTLERCDNNYYYALYTTPLECSVKWSNGKTGKNTKITSNKEIQTLTYTASTEGYKEVVGTLTADKDNVSVSGHITLWQI